MPGIKNFKGKVVVVTGAGSGIGRATAVAFASEGAKVVLSDISEERLTEVRKEIEKKVAGILVHKTDVSDRSQVKALADFVMNEYGRIGDKHGCSGSLSGFHRGLITFHAGSQRGCWGDERTCGNHELK